jgi:hypothetical protein
MGYVSETHQRPSLGALWGLLLWEFNREGRDKVYVYCDDTRDLYNGNDYWVEK